MFDEEYKKLNTSEQDIFKYIIQFLLAHTYIVETEYDFIENMRKTNKNYLFVQRHLNLFQEYFNYAGFTLENDQNYGVIALHSEMDSSRVHFDPLTTKIIFTLRLLYDEKRSQVSLSSDVFVTVMEICQKLQMTGSIQKRLPQNSLRDSLRRISSFQIIQKQAGKWYDPDTRFLVLPSILFIVTGEQVSNIKKLADADNDENSREEEDEEDEETESPFIDSLV